MSENTKVKDNSLAGEEQVAAKGDVDLDNLLSDALTDFGKSMQVPQEHNKMPNVVNIDGLPGTNFETAPFEPSMLDTLWNEPTMKEAMSHFESSIRSVFNLSNENGMSEMTLGSGVNDYEIGVELNKFENDVDVDSLIDDFRKMAKMTAETFSKDGSSDCYMSKNEGNNLFSEEFSKSFIHVAQKLSSSVIKTESLLNEDEDDNGFHNMVSQTIKSLSDNNKEIESCFNLSDCSEQLSKLLKGIENNENVNKNFYGFMKVCMKTIKLVVYPSLKDLCEKYPIYIEDNKSKMSESEMINYKKQFDVMNKICKLFETEEIDDSEKADDNEDANNEKTDKLYKRFLNILNVMKEIQDCGRVPEELDLKRTKFFEEVLSSLSDNQNNNGMNCSIS